MVAMANRAYVSIWTRGFSEQTMLEQFAQLLGTVPFSAQRPGFSELVVRAVDPAETSVLEHDFRSRPADAATMVALAREHLNADCCYEVTAFGDLWVRDAESAHWQLRPQPLEIICSGEKYDGGVFQEIGHFQIGVGFEHLFTGHARLLGASREVAAPQHPAEAEFLAFMAQPENLREYHQKTRENVQKLMHWMQAIEKVLPVGRYALWSEGEENFEARLDEILAVR